MSGKKKETSVKSASPKPEYYELSDSKEMDELAADLAQFMSVADADGFERYYYGDMGVAVFEAKCAITGTPDQVIQTLDSFGGDARAKNLAARVKSIAGRMEALKASQSKKPKSGSKAKTAPKKAPAKPKASQSKKSPGTKSAKTAAKKPASKGSKGAKR